MSIFRLLKSLREYKKEKTTGKFDVTLGVLHIISLVVLVVGIVVSAII